MVRELSRTPEIYSIPVVLPQNPLRSINVYVVRSEGYSLIIDTGFHRPECHVALWEGIRQLDLDLNKTAVFLTHLHSDHSGLAWDFIEKSCPVYMGRIDYEYLAAMMRGEVWPVMEWMARREGYPIEELALQEQGNQGRRYAVEKIFPANLVEDGTQLSVGNIPIRCIHTPGHTPGHMALYLPEQKYLFSGDHILFDITPNISIWKDVRGSLASYMDSLLKVRAMEILQTFPAHRNESNDIYGRIDALMLHHDVRLKTIRSKVNEKPGLTAFALARELPWSARGMPFEQFPPHQKWFAMLETLAHLYYLSDSGYIHKEKENGLLQYYPSHTA